MVRKAKLALEKERIRKKKKSELQANKLLEIEIAVINQRLGASQDEASKPHRETSV
jgi:hypothetical protein